MKKLIYTTIFFSMVSFGFAQENPNVTKKNGTEVNGRLTEAEQKELRAKKDLLTALDKKEAWIRSNPEEMKKAEESGWFKNAEKTRSEVRKRIKELENK
ncbi:MAG: hypothetical protein R2799_01545 [Crocinitomicaceae bacterium]